MTPLPSVLCFVLCAAAADKADDPLVGKWVAEDKVEDMDVEMTLEFVKGGTLKAEVKVGTRTVKMTGKYKVLDAETVELELKQDDKVQKERSKFKIGGDKRDKLTLTDKNGKSLEYKRPAR